MEFDLKKKNYYKMENISKVKDYFQKIQTGSDFDDKFWISFKSSITKILESTNFEIIFVIAIIFLVNKNGQKWGFFQ